MTPEPSERDDEQTESGPTLDVPDDILTQGAHSGSSPDSGGGSEGASGPGTGDESDTSSSAEAPSETGSDRAPADEPEDSDRG